jgi:RND family efflux transporter MFP subunit
MKHAPWFQTTVGVSILVSGVWLAFAGESSHDPSTPAPAPRVRLAPASSTPEVGAYRFAGTVRSVRRAVLAFSTGARLAERSAELGDEVRAGQILARLDVVELDHAVAVAEATLAEIDAHYEQRRREHERVRRLAAAKAATAEELDQAEAAAAALVASRDSARVRLAEARRQLAEGVLRAPYGGVVTAVLAEPGEYLPVGRPVVEIAGDGDLEVEVGLPESLLDRLTAGDEVAVGLPLAAGSSTATTRGTVRSVGRSAQGTGRLFPVVVSLGRPGGFAPGMSTEVLVPRPTQGRLAVPLTAVLNPGSREPSVFVVRDGKAELIPVTVEELAGDRVTLTGALRPGEPVVVAGQSGLAAGELVEVAP